MAKRLKELRNSRGLSHESLSKAMSEKYGISISGDSLQNYEVVNEYHTKAGSNQGMRIEYLRCFADFYCVSTDYLLGLTEASTTDITIRAIADATGLSENVIDWFLEAKKASQYIPNLPTDYSAIMEEYPFRNLLRHLSEYRKAITAETIYSEIHNTHGFTVGYTDEYVNASKRIDQEIQRVANTLEPDVALYLMSIHEFANQDGPNINLAQALFGNDWIIPSELCAHRASRELTYLMENLRENVQNSLKRNEAKENGHD